MMRFVARFSRWGRGPMLALPLGVLWACSGAQPPPAVPGQEPGAEAPAESGAEDGSTPAPSASLSPEAAGAYAAGQQAFEAGDMQGAEAQFAKAIAADPGAYQAHAALGMVLERRGETTRALDAYAKASAIKPDYGPALSARVRLLLASGRAAEAESLVRGLAAKYPDSEAVLGAMAETASARGDSTSAQQYAQSALKKNPDYRPAMVTLARDHYRARRLDLALYTLTAILDGYGPENPPRDKANADARLLRALIYKEQGKRKAAMEEFQYVLSLRPDMVDARLHLAVFMLEAGNALEARPILEKALEYDPSNVLVHLNLGDAYRLLGKPKDALDHLSWVARKDAALSQTHYNLGLVYLFSTGVPGLSEEQAIDHAIESFERFKKLEPRAARGSGDDVDELIARAKNKKAILQAMKEQPAEQPAEPASGGAG